MRIHLLGIPIDRQSRRRALVVTLYAAYAALVACFAFAAPVGVGWGFVALLPLMGILFMSAFLALSQVALPYSGDSFGMKVPEMDERQVQVRDRAFYRAYQTICSMFGLWIVYETIARTNERQWFWMPKSFDEYQAIVWAYLLVSMTLPSAIIAWTEPDLVDADAEADAKELRLAR